MMTRRGTEEQGRRRMRTRRVYVGCAIRGNVEKKLETI
jgi:hypothetical protein